MRAALVVLALVFAGCASSPGSGGGTSEPIDIVPVEALNETVDFSGDPTGAPRSFPFDVPAGYETVRLTAKFSPQAPAAPIVGLRVQLLDPSGKESGEGSGECNPGGGVMTTSNTCERAANATTGGWKVVASGSGAATATIRVTLE